MTKDLVIVGPSSLDLYLKSSARDTDLQVTLSEVRPDGNETYVQNGWLRASHRKLDPRRSTAIDPWPTHLKGDAAPLPRGAYTLVRVPIFPVAHVFRAGSRLRVTVQAVGGDRPRWDFATIDKGHTVNTISLGGKRASSLVLPVIPGATAKGTPLPGATALRGEPNRSYTRRLERRLGRHRLLRGQHFEQTREEPLEVVAAHRHVSLGAGGPGPGNARLAQQPQVVGESRGGDVDRRRSASCRCARRRQAAAERSRGAPGRRRSAGSSPGPAPTPPGV